MECVLDSNWHEILKNVRVTQSKKIMPVTSLSVTK